MGIFEQFPYTNFHDLNLDWVLQTVKALNSSVDDLNTWRTQAIAEIEALQSGQKSLEEAMTALEVLMRQFRDNIQAQFNQLSTDLSEQTAAAIAQNKADTDKAVSDLTTSVNNSISEMQSDLAAGLAANKAATDAAIAQNKQDTQQAIADITATLQAAIAELNATANKQYSELVDLVNEYQAYNSAQIDTKLDAFKHELLEIFPERIIVSDPVTGQSVDIQTALNDMYDALRYYAISAGQFDDMGLTANQFDDLQLTAMQFDASALILTPSKYNLFYMRNPFTGEYTAVRDVVTMLADFHQEAITAQGFDNLQLTANNFDARGLTAYQYDVYGKSLLTA